MYSLIFWIVKILLRFRSGDIELCDLIWVFRKVFWGRWTFRLVYVCRIKWYVGKVGYSIKDRVVFVKFRFFCEMGRVERCFYFLWEEVEILEGGVIDLKFFEVSSRAGIRFLFWFCREFYFVYFRGSGGWFFFLSWLGCSLEFGSFLVLYSFFEMFYNYILFWVW